MMLRVGALFFLSFLCVAFPAWAAESKGLMQQGTAAFQRGAYPEALQYFTEAERGGNRSASLEYNIGVCLYRLQRYKEARPRFIKLSEIPKWRDLSYYNLGLVAEAAGERAEALKWYRQAAAGQSDKLRQLAQRKLTRAEAASPQRNWMALLSFGRGRDSNPASLADEMQTSSSADSYSEWLAYAQTYVRGRARDGIRLYALGFDRSHERLSSLDSRVAGLGLAGEFRWGGYDAVPGIRLTRTLVDSELVANQLQGSLQISRPAAAGTFSLAYLPSRYFSGDLYSQVDGWQHRLEAGWTRRFDAWTLDTRYRFETNDRADLQRDGSFSSYSPQRNSILGKLQRQFGESFDMSLVLEYTRSEYSGENRLRDTDGAVKQAQRSNGQKRIVAGAGYRWNKDWRLKGEYEYLDTADTFDLYTYNKRRLNAAVEYQF